MSEATVLYETHAGVGIVTLNRPQALNSFTRRMHQELWDILDLSVAETLRFYAGLKGVPAETARLRLRSVGLEAWEARRVGELSIGMRQRLGFAVATLSDPPILLLDEPTASLDAGSRTLLVERLRELAEGGKTVVLSTHSERDLAGIATRAVRLEEGRLAA
jgi:ABC-2 type transport system ATP-binding protein